jgi:hypothetical protein
MIRKSNLGKETRLSSTHKIDTPEHNYFRFSGSSAESMYNMKHMQVIFTSTEDRIVFCHRDQLPVLSLIL